MTVIRLILLQVTFITLFSCSHKSEEFVSEKLSDYLPLQPGKYITYRLDSLVYTSFGTISETHRYQAKYVVDAQITDNLGRPSYRVYTYLRDSAGTQSWTATGTFFVTPLTNQIECGFHCFRAIEAIRCAFDKDRWDKMHAALGTTRNDISG